MANIKNIQLGANRMDSKPTVTDRIFTVALYALGVVLAAHLGRLGFLIVTLPQ